VVNADDDAVRTALAELGPFFAVAATGTARPLTSERPVTGEGPVSAVEPTAAVQPVTGEEPGGTAGGHREAWRSMAELADGSGALAARVTAVREALAAGGGQPAAAVEARVAASVVHLGLVARVVAPYLALAVLYGRVPRRVPLADLRWRPALGGPYPLALPSTGEAGVRPVPGVDLGALAHRDADLCALAHGDTDLGALAHGDTALGALADGFAAGVCEGAVRELEVACAEFGVSPHVLRGNTASALDGAARMIAAARPEAAERAGALAGLVLERGSLRGSGRRTATGAFQRRSCCLIYRAAPGRSGALCGDCALSRVPARPS
jgi:hypothetical protein